MLQIELMLHNVPDDMLVELMKHLEAKYLAQIAWYDQNWMRVGLAEMETGRLKADVYLKTAREAHREGYKRWQRAHTGGV